MLARVSPSISQQQPLEKYWSAVDRTPLPQSCLIHTYHFRRDDRNSYDYHSHDHTHNFCLLPLPYNLTISILNNLSTEHYSLMNLNRGTSLPFRLIFSVNIFSVVPIVDSLDFCISIRKQRVPPVFQSVLLRQ